MKCVRTRLICHWVLVSKGDGITTICWSEPWYFINPLVRWSAAASAGVIIPFIAWTFWPTRWGVYFCAFYGWHARKTLCWSKAGINRNLCGCCRGGDYPVYVLPATQPAIQRPISLDLPRIAGILFYRCCIAGCAFVSLGWKAICYVPCWLCDHGEK